jgi:hypothetical protein
VERLRLGVEREVVAGFVAPAAGGRPDLKHQLRLHCRGDVVRIVRAAGEIEPAVSNSRPDAETFRRAVMAASIPATARTIPVGLS